MIEIKELTKVYRSKSGGSCVALDHISFSLPDKGCVFIIGKSGSGKSTLLNMLGCLDTITSGDIIENGRSFANLKVSEQVYYRNSTIGFIFQDFHLLDNLTIFENIMISLQLQGEHDKERVLKVLKDTGLEDFANRFPKELSGGQKQRVAIARALVKSPKILLADEPTGNLDSKTTLQILDLLKELSKEKLVVIVSHNLNNAHAYADEIIELSEGKILQHVKRNQDFDSSLRVEDETLIIPSEQTFSDENIKAISAKMKSGKVRSVKQAKGLFSPCKENVKVPKVSPTPFEKKHLKLKDTAALSWKFARRSWLKMGIYSLLVAALMALLTISQLVMNFNGGEVVANEMAKRNLACNSFIKNENGTYESVDTQYLVNIEDGDIQKFYDAGYEGKIYPLINYSLYLASDNTPVHQKKLDIKIQPYEIDATSGVLITDESFLEKIFGELEYIAKLEEAQPYGIYLTDFIADACLIQHSDKIKSYNDLLGYYNKFTKHCYGYINGIIKTGYKERYGDILEKLTNPLTPKTEVETLSKSDKCIAFCDEICQYLSVAYSFNPNFVEDVVRSGVRQFTGSGNSTFEYNNKEYKYIESYFSNDIMDENLTLNDNEVYMNYDTYNKLFGTTYTKNNFNLFTPHEVKFSYYNCCDENKSNKKAEITLKFMGLHNGYTLFADNIFQEIQPIQMFTFGLYFDNGSQTEIFINTADQNGFLPNSTIASSIATMARVVKVFSKLFSFIFIILCACILAILIQFSVKNVKDKIKEIGVIKALGGRGKDLMFIFGFQTLVVGVLMTLLFVGLSFLFVNFSNSILAFSLVRLAKNSLVLNLSFLSVKWQYLLLDCLLAFGIIVVSFIIPMLLLRAIKPTKVIKANE